MISIHSLKKEEIVRAAMIEKTCFSDPWSEKVYREEFQHVGEYIWLFAASLSEGSDIAGTISLTRMGEDGEIGNVAVLPEYRRQGIAERLLDYVIDFGNQELGMRNFTLEVRAGNGPAIRLYERQGFVVEGVRPGMYQNPREDGKIMWLRTEGSAHQIALTTGMGMPIVQNQNVELEMERRGEMPTYRKND